MTTDQSLLEKRGHSRFKVEIPIQYRIVDNQKVEDWETFMNTSALAKDVSLDGLFLETDKTLEKGGVFRLDISLEDSKKLFAFAEVVWSGPQGAGLRLMMMAEEDKEDFHQYLSKTAQNSRK